MIINSFRTNFLSSLAAKQGNAAVFAGPEMERVIDQQVFLLSNYVAGQLSASYLSPHIMRSKLGEYFHNINQFPFVGLLTLLTSNDGDPYSVFRTSLADKDHLLAKFSAQQANSKRYIHDFDVNELIEFKQGKLHQIYQKLEKRVNIFKMTDRLNHKFLQPAINWYSVTMPLLNEILNQSEVDFRFRSITSGSASATTYLINQMLMPGEHLRYATFTHQIRKNLNLILKNQGQQNIISERVSKVLGCELIAG